MEFLYIGNIFYFKRKMNNIRQTVELSAGLMIGL